MLSSAQQKQRDASSTDGPDLWRSKWENDATDEAVVDVDVRGWVFAHHRGPMNRKNKLVMGVARQLSGIPAPRHSPSGSTVSSRPASPFEFGDRMQSHASKHQDEIAFREAESIVRRGEAEAVFANQGRYSERPTQADSSADNSRSPSRETSPVRFRDEFARQRRNQIRSDEGDRRGQISTTTSRMSQAEAAIANANLLERVRFFMANPLANLPIRAFFYNNVASRMSSAETDASGQFSIRQPLNFTPTHVKILALDGLSDTQEIRITAQYGVSIISDIDDTIKHSAITSGAKEIFRNVFVRDLGELSIDGVRAWYNQMAKLGCEFHYVSNSPWQMYPVLSKFFEIAGLPPGSFHLKQYSGMLQGIFEPVAERKKAAIDRLMRDFPDRQFILVGDSGEADLEVYTDVVRDYPGRTIGVYIRDVTTSRKKSFFDPARLENGDGSHNPLPKAKSKPSNLTQQASGGASGSSQEDADLREAIARSLADVGRPPDALERSLSRHQKSGSNGSPARPPLPPRQTAPAATEEENLIDLESDYGDLPESRHANSGELPKNWLRPPPPPSKPRSLSANPVEHSPSRDAPTDSERNDILKPAAPPRPRKPSTSVHVKNEVSHVHTDPSRPPAIPWQTRPSDEARTAPTPKNPAKKERPPPPPQRQSYRDAARQKLTEAYNKMPSPKDIVFGSRPGTPRTSPTHSRSSSIEPIQWERSSREPSLADLMNEERGRPPPLPPRRSTGISTTFQDMGIRDDEHLAYGDSHSYAKRYSSAGSMYSGYDPQQNQVLSKKELAWQYRWEKAQAFMKSQGVTLKSWRVGEEVQQDATELIKRTTRNVNRGERT